MILRPIKPEEIHDASKIVRANYSKKYEKLSFREIEAMFKNDTDKPQYIVAEEKGEIIGFAGYIQSWMDYHVYEIFWVNVTPSRQNKGIGTALVKKIIQIISRKKDAKMVLLTARNSKFYARKFKFKKLASYESKTGKHDIMFLTLHE